MLTLLSEDPPRSFGVLYIAPLKSLINDQFSRMEELLEESGLPVFHWHGDVAQSHKARALRNPSGILQMTPESLEAMLMRRGSDVIRLFSDLRFVILDEIHMLTGTDRGSQILCQLVRLQRLIGHCPRRIGLSATIGDLQSAAAWLGAGTGRLTEAPAFSDERTHWRIGAEHFYIQNAQENQTESAARPQNAAEGENSVLSGTSAKEDAASGYALLDPGFEYLYDCCAGKKCLVFSNSREETEYITATFRQIAEHRGEPDLFYIHHGNLSAALREEAEQRLKEDDRPIVTCATVTMELGVDIGRLQRVLQLEAPHTVSSLLQRLGRSGRRGDPPEMMMVFREENPLPNTPLPQLIPWGLLRAIALIQLYLEERFMEPPISKKLPWSLLFQQTLSVLFSSGSLTPAQLAERVLTLPPFHAVTRAQYRCLLASMLNRNFLEMDEEGELLVGLKGERLTNSFHFFAVFQDSEDYTVRCESDEIGTITMPPPVGDRFALAGRVWEVEELDLARRLIYVRAVRGKMKIEWPGDFGEIHTRILERMRQVLEEDVSYPYLKKNAAARLTDARALARRTGMLRHALVHLGGFSWCFFPWLGTRSFRTMRRYIMRNSAAWKLSHMEFEGCYYMTFRAEAPSGLAMFRGWYEKICREGIDCQTLVGENEAPVFEKYDDLIPAELLREAFAQDRLRSDEILRRMPELMERWKRSDERESMDWG